MNTARKAGADLSAAKAIARDMALFRGPFWEYPPFFLWEKIGRREVMDAWRGIGGASVELFVNSALCASKCRYCDYTPLPLRGRADLVNYLELIKSQADSFSFIKGVRALYISGGDLADVPGWYLERLFAILDERFRIGDLNKTIGLSHSVPSPQLLRFVGGHKFSRAVFQVQSADRDLSRKIRRPLDRARLEKSVELLRRAGVKEIKFEWVVGIPGQTPENLARDFECFKKIGPDAIAVVNFRSGPYTLRQAFERGRLALAAPDIPVSDVLLRGQVLKTAKDLAGSRAFRVSSERGSSVLGLGHAAVSHVFGALRYASLAASPGGQAGAGRLYGVRMTPDREILRYVILQLFDAGCVAEEDLAAVFGRKARPVLSGALSSFERSGQIGRTGGRWTLAKRDALSRAVFAAALFEKDFLDRFNRGRRARRRDYRNVEADLVRLYDFRGPAGKSGCS